MREFLNGFSILMLAIGGISFAVGLLMLIASIFVDDKKWVTIGLRCLLFGFLIFISGFTLCSATFSLGRMN